MYINLYRGNKVFNDIHSFIIYTLKCLRSYLNREENLL
jgi:hypothetical protein